MESGTGAVAPLRLGVVRTGGVTANCREDRRLCETKPTRLCANMNRQGFGLDTLLMALVAWGRLVDNCHMSIKDFCTLPRSPPFLPLSPTLVRQ